MTRKLSLGLVLSTGLALLLYGLVAWRHDPAALWGALQRIDARDWTWVLSLSLFNYGLRYLRWSAALQALSRRALPHGQHLLIYLAGFAFTTTPGKAGEALRGVALRAHGIEHRHSLATFFWERLLDLLAVLLLSLGALSALPLHGGWMSLVALPLLLAGWLLKDGHAHALLQRLAARTAPGGLPQRLCLQLQALLHGLATLLQGRWLLGGGALGLLAWAAEGWGLHQVLRALGHDLPVVAVVGLYALSMLAGALSFIPGGLGTAEAVMALGLTTLGCDLTTALAATLICRVATLWFAVALGGLALGGLALQRLGLAWRGRSV